MFWFLNKKVNDFNLNYKWKTLKLTNHINGLKIYLKNWWKLINRKKINWIKNISIEKTMFKDWKLFIIWETNNDTIVSYYINIWEKLWDPIFLWEIENFVDIDDVAYYDKKEEKWFILLDILKFFDENWNSIYFVVTNFLIDLYTKE